MSHHSITVLLQMGNFPIFFLYTVHFPTNTAAGSWSGASLCPQDKNKKRPLNARSPGSLSCSKSVKYESIICSFATPQAAELFLGIEKLHSGESAKFPDSKKWHFHFNFGIFTSGIVKTTWMVLNHYGIHFTSYPSTLPRGPPGELLETYSNNII